MRILIVLIAIAQITYAGIERLPLVLSASNTDWSARSLDQEMAPGILMEAMFEHASDETKIVAFSSPLKEKTETRLRDFALGIKDSFAAHGGVRNLKEEKRSIADTVGIVMSFTLGEGPAEKRAALFVIESGKHFFAYMAFGPSAGVATLQLLKKKKNE